MLKNVKESPVFKVYEITMLFSIDHQTKCISIHLFFFLLYKEFLTSLLNSAYITILKSFKCIA